MNTVLLLFIFYNLGSQSKGKCPGLAKSPQRNSTAEPGLELMSSGSLLQSFKVQFNPQAQFCRRGIAEFHIYCFSPISISNAFSLQVKSCVSSCQPCRLTLGSEIQLCYFFQEKTEILCAQICPDYNCAALLSSNVAPACTCTYPSPSSPPTPEG